jgi:threonine aldolase
MQFASDNWTGAAPEVIDAVVREAARSGAAYGASEIDKAVEARFSEIFEREVAVFFVATGSAANALAFAAVSRPAGAVFAHAESHILEDEIGGVEFLAGGARVVPVEGPLGKLDPAALKKAVARFAPGDVRAGQPTAVTITQQSEMGTIYSLAEIQALADIARGRGISLHMDGARFSYALARLGVTPAEMTWKAGVDILSFGATKNGCIAAEALVFFDPESAKDMPYICKRAGHLFSKSRFVAAQFDAYLRDGLWLRLARHANDMGERLRTGLAALPNARVAWPTNGNETFAVLRAKDAERLRMAGAAFYDWPEPHGYDARLAGDEMIVRLVTAFSTRPEDVDGFLSQLRA